MRVFYACQGVTVKPSRPGSTYYLNGAQSFSSDYELSSMTVKDHGRSQSDRLFLPTSNEITIERVISNYTNETDRITGPLLHYIFSANSLYNQATGPSSYKQGLLSRLIGTSITGTSSDILEYDLELIYQKETDILKSSQAISSLKFMRSLLSGISYSISTDDVLKESLSFLGKNIEIGSGAYDLSPIYTNNFNSGKFIRIIRPYNFSNALSVFPTELLQVIDDNTFFDKNEIYGLKSISTSLGIDYATPKDQGKWLGSSDSTESNFWTMTQFPFNIECSFTFVVRKSIDTPIKNKQNNFVKSPIRLVFQCFNHDGTSGNNFIINLGKNNYLKSISISGGSTSGDLVEYTYTYINSSNDFLTYFNNVGNFTAADQSSNEKY